MAIFRRHRSHELYATEVPTWEAEVGVAADYRPLYEGAKTYRVLGGPVSDIRYEDMAFFSAGEGLGVNLVRGTNYRAGVSIGYDLGIRDEQDLTRLKGLGNIGRAPDIKLFGDYVLSKDFPLVLRVDARSSWAAHAAGWGTLIFTQRCRKARKGLRGLRDHFSLVSPVRTAR